MLLSVAAVFVAVLLALWSGFDGDRAILNAVVLGVLGYPGLFLLGRARNDYGAGWKKAAGVALAGMVVSGATLLLTVTLGLQLGIVLIFLNSVAVIAPVFLLAATCHGLVLAFVEEWFFFERLPPRLYAVSAATLAASMGGLFLASMGGDGLPKPLLAGAAALSVLPHLALMPAPMLPAVGEAGGT